MFSIYRLDHELQLALYRAVRALHTFSRFLLGRIFFWTHFRLSRWMATHLRMRSATPSVYFDLEKGVLTMIEQNDCQL